MRRGAGVFQRRTGDRFLIILMFAAGSIGNSTSGHVPIASCSLVRRLPTASGPSMHGSMLWRTKLTSFSAEQRRRHLASGAERRMQVNDRLANLSLIHISEPTRLL